MALIFATSPPDSSAKRSSVSNETIVPSKSNTKTGMKSELIHLPEQARKLGLRDLYVKYEGNNPTGTHKDRLALFHVKRAQGRKVVAASCGNLGVALAKKGQELNTPVEIWIPESFKSPRIKEMLSYGASIVRKPLTYEECVAESRKLAPYDANPGGENSTFEFECYKEIGEEILEDLPDASLVGVPVSNGTTAVGISLCGLKVYAGSTEQNPIITSYTCKEYKPLNPKDLIETEINEPLINWDSLDGKHALSVLSGAVGAKDSELKELADLMPFSTHPSAVAGLYSIIKLAKDAPKPVAIITSRNY